MTRKQLENLAFHQMYLLIKKEKYADELKAIWKRRWNLEYPYWTDCTGKIQEVGR